MCPELSHLQAIWFLCTEAMRHAQNIEQVVAVIERMEKVCDLVQGLPCEGCPENKILTQ